MQTKPLIAIAATAATLAWRIEAQTYDTNNIFVQTFAGSGFYGLVNGQGSLTMFNGPSQIVSDTSSNLFVLDNGNGAIRKTIPDGTVATFAMVGVSGALGSMAIDHSNALWITYGPGGMQSGFIRFDTNGSASYRSGSGLSSNSGVCVDSTNNLYYSDYFGHKIYRLRTNTNTPVEVFAGSGNPGYADGNGIFTAFLYPGALAADGAGNIYVWEWGNKLIRKIDQNRNVTTLAGKQGQGEPRTDGVGTNAAFSDITQMCVDVSGNIIAADGLCVRKISPSGIVVTLAGSFAEDGYVNGPGSLARFRSASGVCISQSVIFVVDAADHRIRNLSFNPSSEPVLPASLNLDIYPGLKITGIVGRTYQIQSSPDLTNWTTRATIPLPSATYLWFDENPIAGNKFYQALLLP